MDLNVRRLSIHCSQVMRPMARKRGRDWGNMSEANVSAACACRKCGKRVPFDVRFSGLSVRCSCGGSIPMVPVAATPGESAASGSYLPPSTGPHSNSSRSATLPPISLTAPSQQAAGPQRSSLPPMSLEQQTLNELRAALGRPALATPGLPTPGLATQSLSTPADPIAPKPAAARSLFTTPAIPAQHAAAPPSGAPEPATEKSTLPGFTAPRFAAASFAGPAPESPTPAAPLPVTPAAAGTHSGASVPDGAGAGLAPVDDWARRGA